MPVFTHYVMVDWSAANRGRPGRADWIWIAHGPRGARAPRSESPASRTEATERIRSLLEDVARAPRDRALVGCDFGYGYPEGFAALLPGGNGVPPWRRVWEHLAREIRDDEGRKSNRFEVASAINEKASSPESPGPFWCLPRAGGHPRIPQRKPKSFASRGTLIPALRETDERADSDTPFRLFGTGSVGSQILTGIPRLHSLRFDPNLSACSVVWPFETGWAPRSGRWLDRRVRVVHAEIYPSVHRPRRDRIKDRGQVRAMWHWARDLDARGRLVEQFAIPRGIVAGSPADLVIRREEGWILGCPDRKTGDRQPATGNRQ